MAATVTPVQGYLAGIFRSPGVTVSSATVHELVRNGDFELGALTNWTDNATGSRSAVTASKGYNEMSYGLVLSEDGPSGNTVQVTGSRELDVALTSTNAADYDVVLSCWCKPAETGKTGSLKVLLYDPTGTVLSSGSVAIVDHDYYGSTNWGYYSVRIDAETRTTGIQWEIASNMASGTTGTFYVDNVSCAIVEQVAGAHGSLAMADGGWVMVDKTTFGSVGSDGPFRRFEPTMREPARLHVDSFYTTESVGAELAAQERVFVVLATKKATKTADRWEFWARPIGLSHIPDTEGVHQEPFDLQADGLIGFADS